MSLRNRFMGIYLVGENTNKILHLVGVFTNWLPVGVFTNWTPLPVGVITNWYPAKRVDQMLKVLFQEVVDDTQRVSIGRCIEVESAPQEMTG